MITIIAAVSTDGFIGKENKIPWRLKSDVDHFKITTTGHTIVIGRKTWESIDPRFRPLPGRRNIILSRQADFSAEGIEVVHSIEEALKLTEDSEHVFFMGGEEVYLQTLPFAERLLITQVHKTIGDGDARFPVLDWREWNLVSSTEGVRGEKDECGFTIKDYSPNLRYIELANVRTFDQLKVMRQIQKAGHCPFCMENLLLYHQSPILWEGKHWVLTENQWPYPGKNVHFLLILKEHGENISFLTDPAQQEFFSIVRNLEIERKFPGGGVCMRSGDPILSGATVKHLHAQIVSPTRGSEPVKFYIGTSRRAAP